MLAYLYSYVGIGLAFAGVFCLYLVVSVAVLGAFREFVCAVRFLGFVFRTIAVALCSSLVFYVLVGVLAPFCATWAALMFGSILSLFALACLLLMYCYIVGLSQKRKFFWVDSFRKAYMLFFD